MEDQTVVQNKIALSAFYIATFLGIVSLLEPLSSQDKLLGIIKYLLYTELGSVALFFLLFLFFLPLIYTSNRNIIYFRLYLLDCSISKEDINKLFEKGARLLPITIINIFTGLPLMFIINLAFEGNIVLITYPETWNRSVTDTIGIVLIILSTLLCIQVIKGILRKIIGFKEHP